MRRYRRYRRPPPDLPPFRSRLRYLAMLAYTRGPPGGAGGDCSPMTTSWPRHPASFPSSWAWARETSSPHTCRSHKKKPPKRPLSSASPPPSPRRHRPLHLRFDAARWRLILGHRPLRRGAGSPPPLLRRPQPCRAPGRALRQTAPDRPRPPSSLLLGERPALSLDLSPPSQERTGARILERYGMTDRHEPLETPMPAPRPVRWDASPRVLDPHRDLEGPKEGPAVGEEGSSWCAARTSLGLLACWRRKDPRKLVHTPWPAGSRPATWRDGHPATAPVTLLGRRGG